MSCHIKKAIFRLARRGGHEPSAIPYFTKSSRIGFCHRLFRQAHASGGAGVASVKRGRVVRHALNDWFWSSRAENPRSTCKLLERIKQFHKITDQSSSLAPRQPAQPPLNSPLLTTPPRQ